MTINGDEKRCVIEFIQGHLKSEKFHIKKMNRAIDFLMELKDPDDHMVSVWESNIEEHRKGMVTQRRAIEELALLIGARVKFTRPLDKMMVVNPTEVDGFE